MTVDIAALGLKVDSTPVEKANASLDKLAEKGAKVEQSAQRMGGSFSKAARDIEAQVTRMVTTQQRMVQQQERTNELLEQYSKASQRSTQGSDSAKSAADRFIATLEKQAATLGMTRTQILSYEAAQLGVADKAAPLIARMQAAEKQITSTGISARAAANNLRMLPAQMTDIAVGLSTGQSPLVVLAQQGGQLKDIFGGVGPAVRAVGGYIAGLVTPTTVAAAAIVGLAVAHEMGAQQAREHARAIILSGNAAGTTTGQLRDMTDHVSALVGTTGEAAEVLNLMVSSGRIPADQLESYATLTLRLQRLGVEAKDTVGDLTALAKDPAQASAKLNDVYNYLTPATYRQIKALQDLGQAQEAANLAQKAYADAQEQRVPQLEAQLGLLERGWLKVKEAIKGTGDALLGIGKPDTMADLQARMAAIQGNALGRARGGNFTLSAGEKAELDAIQQQIAAMRELEKFNRQAAATQQQQADATRATVAFDKLAEQSLSRQEKIAREVAKARELGLKAGASQAEIEKVIASIAYETSKLGIEAQIERLQGIQQVLEVRTKGVLADLDAQRRMGAMNERMYVEQVAAAELAAMDQRRAILEQQMALKAKERDSQKEVQAVQREISVLDEQKLERQKQLNRDIAVMNEQLERARTLAKMEMNQEFLDSWGKAIQENTDAFAAAGMEIYRYQQSVQDANDEVDFQIGLMGRSTREIALANAQRRVELELRQKIRAIDENTKLGAEEKDILRQRASKIATEAAAKASTEVWVREWDRANQEVAQGLEDVLTGSGKNAADRLKRLFAELVLRPILAPVSAGITSLFMGSGPSLGGGVPANPFAGGGSGLGGMLGFPGADAFTLFGAGGLGGSLAAGAGWLTGSTTLGGALGAAGSLIGTGTAGGIASGLGMAAGALGPIALGAYGLYSLFGKGGETRSGATYRNGAVLHGPSGGQINGAQAATAATMASINTLLAQLGSQARLTDFLSALESSKNGKGFAYAGGTLSTGATFGQFSEGLGRSNRRGSKTPEEAMAEYGEELKQATLQALQAANVPGLVGDYLRSLGNVDALSGGALDEAVARVQKALQEKQTLEETWYQLTATDAEKLAHSRQLELDALDVSNRAMAARIYALQDEIAAQEKAKAAYAEAKGAVDDLSKRVGSYIDKLNATGAGLLSPYEQLANARSQFDRQLGLARGGDRDAMGSITDYADQLLKAQIGYTASGPATQAVIAQIKQALGDLPGQVSAEEFVAKSVHDGAFLLNASMQELIARADANSAAQIAAITRQASDENAARTAASAASAAAASAAAGTKAANPTEGWTITENGWTWIGSGPAPGLDPFHRFAGGGDHLGGIRLVGEMGPELENTGPSRIFSAEQTRRILSGGAGSDPEVKKLLRQLIETVERSTVVNAAGLRAQIDRLQRLVDNTGVSAQAVQLKAAEAP